MPSRDAPGEGRRYYAMDNLRAWMMLLLIPFHAGIPFITVRAPQYFNDPDAHVFFDGMSLFLLSFRRPLFFVVAGFFAAMLLDRRGLKEMLHNRFQRIVLPLVLGWIVLSPATRAAYKFAAKASSTGSIEQGYDVLRTWEWLTWDKPWHLWFLLALLLFYGLALALRWALPRVFGSKLQAFDAAVRWFLGNPYRSLLLALGLAAGFIPSEFYPYYRGNPFLALSLALFFALGWQMYLHRDLLESQARNAWTCVAAGVVVLPLATWFKQVHLQGNDNPLAWAIASGIAQSLMSGFLVFGVLGAFLKHSDHKNKTLRYLSDSSYWIYLAHFPLVVFIGGVLATTSLSAASKVSINVALVTAIVLVTYHYCVRYTAIGRLLNGPRARGGDAG